MKVVNNEQTKLILILLAVVMIFCSYQFGFSRYNDKTTTLNDENQQLEDKIAELEGLVEKQDIYESGITEYTKTAKDITDLYGVGVSLDKTIMFLVELEEQADMEISAVTFNNENMLLAAENVPDKIAQSTVLYAYSVPVTITYKTTYQGFKDCMTFINGYAERMNVTELNTTYDSETGNLSGTMLITMYYVSGTEREFEKPDITGINIGTNNIFGTLEIGTSN